MSVDSPELQRATLERKDKEELTTIAAALGVKAGSRMKKADIIDLILSASGRSTPDPEGTRDKPERTPARAGAEASSSADGADGASDSAGAATESAEKSSDAGVKESRRRPPARLVGWSGDPAVEASGDEPSLFDAPASSSRSRRGSRSGGAAREAATAEAAASATDSADTASTESDQGNSDAGRSDAGKPAVAKSDRRSDADGTANRESDGAGTRSSDTRSSDDAATDDRSKDDRSGDAKAGTDEERSDSNGRGSASGSDTDDSGDNRGDGETGNRRRRRRGRDRDRARSDDSQGQRTDRPQQDDGFQGEPVPVSGYLDLRDEGYGFLRINAFIPSRDDAYVSVRQARQLGLRKGDFLTGASRPAGRNEKNPALLRIDTVNGEDPELARNRPRFEDLTPLFPDERLRLEVRDDPYNMTARIIDLVSPIGKGQRGLIVSPPKAGKTTILKQIARSIEINNPEVHLIVLLVDERPEEVTDMKRWLKQGEVAASTFDRPAEEHIAVAELTIERAKRMVEAGKDVCIMLDGITRLARAYNLGAPATGRIMSGGIDTGALYPPKKFFGAARNIEEGGSLTILATALVETGSRMDEVIFEEFKGTGNMELKLDRRLAERRIYPAIDADASSTRHEELLFDRKQLQQVWKLRRVLSALRSDGDGGAAAGIELLIDRLKTFRTNDEFLEEIAKGPAA